MIGHSFTSSTAPAETKGGTPKPAPRALAYHAFNRGLVVQYLVFHWASKRRYTLLHRVHLPSYLYSPQFDALIADILTHAHSIRKDRKIDYIVRGPLGHFHCERRTLIAVIDDMFGNDQHRLATEIRARFEEDMLGNRVVKLCQYQLTKLVLRRKASPVDDSQLGRIEDVNDVYKSDEEFLSEGEGSGADDDEVDPAMLEAPAVSPADLKNPNHRTDRPAWTWVLNWAAKKEPYEESYLELAAAVSKEAVDDESPTPSQPTRKSSRLSQQPARPAPSTPRSSTSKDHAPAPTPRPIILSPSPPPAPPLTLRTTATGPAGAAALTTPTRNKRSATPESTRTDRRVRQRTGAGSTSPAAAPTTASATFRPGPLSLSLPAPPIESPPRPPHPTPQAGPHIDLALGPLQLTPPAPRTDSPPAPRIAPTSPSSRSDSPLRFPFRAPLQPSAPSPPGGQLSLVTYSSDSDDGDSGERDPGPFVLSHPSIPFLSLAKSTEPAPSPTTLLASEFRNSPNGSPPPGLGSNFAASTLVRRPRPEQTLGRTDDPAPRPPPPELRAASPRSISPSLAPPHTTSPQPTPSHAPRALSPRPTPAPAPRSPSAPSPRSPPRAPNASSPPPSPRAPNASSAPALVAQPPTSKTPNATAMLSAAQLRCVHQVNAARYYLSHSHPWATTAWFQAICDALVAYRACPPAPLGLLVTKDELVALAQATDAHVVASGRDPVDSALAAVAFCDLRLVNVDVQFDLVAEIVDLVRGSTDVPASKLGVSQVVDSAVTLMRHCAGMPRLDAAKFALAQVALFDKYPWATVEWVCKIAESVQMVHGDWAGVDREAVTRYAEWAAGNVHGESREEKDKAAIELALAVVAYDVVVSEHPESVPFEYVSGFVSDLQEFGMAVTREAVMEGARMLGTSL